MRIPRIADLLCAAIAVTCPTGLLAKDVPPPFPFPEPVALAPAVKFWTRVYTELDSASGFIHDSHNLDVVYGTLYLNPDAPPRAQNKAIEEALGEYRIALLSRVFRTPPALTADPTPTTVQTWVELATEDELEAAAERLRFQRGQSDRILTGLTRFAHWRTEIQGALEKHGVPAEIAALPLVESSYNPRAVSKAGAVGLWQFMPATARLYLQVDDQVDERLDPMKSSEAAALLLKHNYSLLKRWPLAITAYNHGVSGVRRAVRETGTDDMGIIAATHETERFGFASRNFYAAVLAAVKVSRDPGCYFHEYLQDAADQIALVTPAYLPIDALVDALVIDKERLRTLNPALHHAVWNGTQLVPKGYVLQLPGTYADSRAEEQLAELAQNYGFKSQIPDPRYDVRFGDSLSGIAQTYGTTAAKLMQRNKLANADQLQAGQILRVPLMPDPKPLGEGAAAMLAAQSPMAEADSPELPHQASAPEDREGTVGQDGQSESPQEPAPSGGNGGTQAVDAPESEPTDSQKPDDEAARVFPAAQPDLAADPLDYTVAADQTIEIQVGETLGHYADWLQLGSEQVTRLEELQSKGSLIVGRRLKLEFSNTGVDQFEKRRIGFHESRLRRFLSRHRIKGVIEHQVGPGDSLWSLAVERYGVPLWLLRQYNPDVAVDSVLAVGSLISVPDVEDLPDEPSSAFAQAAAVGPSSDSSASEPTSGSGGR